MKERKTILIVDDNTGIIDILTLILNNTGYEVITDNSGDLHCITDGMYPDLILLDHQLGKKLGADICKQLKSNEETKHIPIILVSATSDLEEIAESACADDFLLKPFGIQQLLQKVENALSRDISVAGEIGE